MTLVEGIVGALTPRKGYPHGHRARAQVLRNEV